MSSRFAAWVLCLVALVCGLSGAGLASRVLTAYRVEPSSLGFVVAEAMIATTLLVLAGGAVIGLIVLRGVAEMLNQAFDGAHGLEPAAGPGQGSSSPAHEGLTD